MHEHEKHLSILTTPLINGLSASMDKGCYSKMSGKKRNVFCKIPGLREAFAKLSATSALANQSHLCGGEGEVLKIIGKMVIPLIIKAH